ncbi:MAG: ATP-binding protein [Steroidobacteraceae bacterium]
MPDSRALSSQACKALQNSSLSAMKLRTRLNLVLTGLTAIFVVVLVLDEIRNIRSSVREEIEAANLVAAQVLGRLTVIYEGAGEGPALLDLVQQLGHVRANEITLRTAGGELLYHSPPPTYKAGREAPHWFSRLLAPEPAQERFELPAGMQLVIDAQPSRSILDAWDDLTRLVIIAVVTLAVVSGLAFWLVGRALAPFPVIVNGLERLQRGELAFRLPPLSGSEAHAIGAAFNRMAQAVQDNVRAERDAQEARTRLEERRELAQLLEQSIEEERRLIAHELHDEFGQSVTAIRSLAMAIATQSQEPATADTARLISAEAARLYDAMHGLIPRLAPPALDSLGLSAALESLVADWQRRHPTPLLSLHHELPADLGGSVTLAAYRLVQEGLLNALRHAQATQVAIAVTAAGGNLLVSVEDNGVGLPEQWSLPGRFGLRGLRERVERLGGAFGVRNVEPHGVRLTAEIPLGVSA